MIKIIKAQPVPKEQIECANCGSILEYENADLEFIEAKVTCNRPAKTLLFA